MQHIIYAILVVILVIFFVLNMQRATLSAQNHQHVNEIATQFNRIGADVLERIGRTWFDERTREDTSPPPTFPIITTPGMLTATGSAEWGGCTDFYAAACNDIDDFDGLSLVRSWEGVDYEVDVAVRYVQPGAPGTPSGTQTYAKEVRLTIRNPHLRLGAAVLEVEMARVFVYDRITSTI